MEETHRLENHMIQQLGFRNISVLGQVAGFQVRIRIVGYKGFWINFIGGAEVSVDGETFKGKQITWTIGERAYTQDELPTDTDHHWHWTEPATLTVNKPGGLKPGDHKVRVRVDFLEGTTPHSIFTRNLILV